MNKKIDKKLIEYLAELARLNLGKNENVFLNDFREIVGYFDKLKKLNTDRVTPMSGGTFLENVLKEDVYKEERRLSPEEAIDSFPATHNGFLKIPPVFD